MPLSQRLIKPQLFLPIPQPRALRGRAPGLTPAHDAHGASIAASPRAPQPTPPAHCSLIPSCVPYQGSQQSLPPWCVCPPQQGAWAPPDTHPLSPAPGTTSGSDPALPAPLGAVGELRQGAVEHWELLPGVYARASEAEQGWVTLGISLGGVQMYLKTVDWEGDAPTPSHIGRGWGGSRSS